MTTAAVAGRARWTAERRFFTGLSLAALVVVYVGFARTFFLRPLFPDAPAPTEPFFLFHGVVFACWPVLLALQTSLVGAGRIDVHRKLGALGAVLAAAMVVLGVTGALIAADRPTGFVGLPVPPLQFLIVPIVDMLLFATFIALAVRRRRDAQAHKRWMILGTASLLVAAVARWPGVISIPNPLVFMGLADLFVVALAVWDFRSRGRLHPVTLWGGLALIISQPLRLALSETPVWLAIAAWATSLVG
jgi:hypothetical protein